MVTRSEQEIKDRIATLREGWFTSDCHRCEWERSEALYALTDSFIDQISHRMILCSVCGNKRCPKATYHDYECTGSNEPGQEGSVY